MKDSKKIIATLFAVGIAFMMLIPAGIVAQDITEPDMAGQSTLPEATASGGGDREINTIVIQPNATEGKDSFIYEHYPSDNYGGDAGMCVGDWSGSINSLIQFPIPQNPSTIKEAHLSLYATYLNNDDYFNVEAHMLTSAWTEGTGTFSPLVPSYEDSNWNDSTTGTPWNTAGGDYDSTVIS